MIYAYNLAEQEIPVDGLISYTTNGLKTCCAIQHPEGSETFTIKRAGYYIVEVHLDATTATPSELTFGLFNKGVLVPGASSKFTVVTADNFHSYAFAAVIKVPPSCAAIDNTAILTVRNMGENAATVTNAAIIIRSL